MTYDNNDRLASLKALGSSTGYSYQYYESSSDVATVTDPNANTTTYSYDDLAYPTQPTSEVDGSSNVTSKVYDADGRTCFSYPANAYSAAATDPLTQPTCQSASTVLASYPGSTVYTYDGDGDTLTDTVPHTSSTSTTTSYTYGDVNDPTLATKELTPQSPTAVANTYDLDGRLASTDNQLGKTTYFGYDADSNQCLSVTNEVLSTTATCTVPSGSTNYQTATFDAMDRALQTAEVEDYKATEYNVRNTYTYDADSNVLSNTLATGHGGGTVYYGYNTLDEATCIAYPVDFTGTTCSGTPSATNTIVTRGYDADGNCQRSSNPAVQRPGVQVIQHPCIHVIPQS